jgi:D-alanyl-D-alanine carboxypeptidase
VRLAALLAVGAIALIANVVTAATPATATATRTPSQAPPLPKAYVLVDVDTGAVLAQQATR